MVPPPLRNYASNDLIGWTIPPHHAVDWACWRNNGAKNLRVWLSPDSLRLASLDGEMSVAGATQESSKKSYRGTGDNFCLSDATKLEQRVRQYQHMPMFSHLDRVAESVLPDASRACRMLDVAKSLGVSITKPSFEPSSCPS